MKGHRRKNEPVLDLQAAVDGVFANATRPLQERPRCSFSAFQYIDQKRQLAFTAAEWLMKPLLPSASRRRETSVAPGSLKR